MQKEIWKDVKGYKGLYQVSNLGRVKGQKGQLLSPNKDGKGYMKVNLYKATVRKTRVIHQLVAESFLNHTVNGHVLVVNHIDLDKTNNRLDNLEVVTQRENSNRKHLKSKSKYIGVSWHKGNGKWLSRIRVDGKLKHLGYYDNEIKASEAYQLELDKLKTKNNANR